jgi:hypothetical protein
VTAMRISIVYRSSSVCYLPRCGRGALLARGRTASLDTPQELDVLPVTPFGVVMVALRLFWVPLQVLAQESHDASRCASAGSVV